MPTNKVTTYTLFKLQYGYEDTEDACTTCTCTETGRYLCAMMECAELHCPLGVAVREPGECCETCVMPTTMVPGNKTFL